MPWRTARLEDYEAHVEYESVGQAAVIRAAIAAAIETWKPESFLYLGCAGGNGLEAASGVPRVIGLDLNPGYLETAATRYPKIETVCWNLDDGAPDIEAVDLIFAALVLEYVADLPKLLRGLRCHGALVVLLLGVHAGAPAVLPSPYREALSSVGAAYREVPVEKFLAAASDWALLDRQTIELPSGKYFTQLTVQRTAPGTAA